MRPASALRDHRVRGWLIAAGVTAVAAAVRLPDLTRPHKLVFDETYYVKDAWTLLNLGYAAVWPDKPNPAFEAGDVDTYLIKPSYVVHPDVGKWLIALGEKAFGVESSFGWRISAAVAGIAMVLLVTRIGRRLFRSDALGAVAGMLVAVDGLGIVMSRTGLLDIFLAVLVTAAFGALLLDRDGAAARLERLMPGDSTRFGPHLGLRGWRLAAGVLLGLACGVKWSGLWFLAVFGLLSVGWDAAARRRAGVRAWWQSALLRDALPAFVSIALVAGVSYVASWWSWFAHPDAYDRYWAQRHPGEGVTWLPDVLRSWAHYHGTVWDFHTHLTSEHTYDAQAWGWLIQWRPTSFFYETPDPSACGAAKCSQAITSLGNPLIWWLGSLALLVAIWWVVRHRDGAALAVVAGIFAGWFPWFLFPERTIFTFYAIVILPFLALTLAWAVGRFTGLGDPDRSVARWRVRTAIGVGVAIVLVSAFYYPIWTAWTVPFRFWQLHMWMPSWV